ncbi:GFA family protein [Shewanella marina]|uniref:GFA family protein n=1 Tax=Shewanella marina TaxID=487319 RepID=UPI00046EA4D6|nr:aldehyde-activating protein [Shewanella marina]
MLAQCHCGNVTISMAAKIEQVTHCNCSICYRLGAIWAYFLPEQVQVNCSVTSTKTYRHGDQYIDFHHCPVCGCCTHYTMTERIDMSRVAVNLRMTDADNINQIDVRYFDGASM